jgi:hypothetical protein
MTLPYPPPYQDINVLAEHISLAPRTIEEWVKLGKLPAPKVRSGKHLWKWKEVEQCLDGNAGLVPSSPDDETARIREATRGAVTTKAR